MGRVKFLIKSVFPYVRFCVELSKCLRKFSLNKGKLKTLEVIIQVIKQVYKASFWKIVKQVFIESLSTNLEFLSIIVRKGKQKLDKELSEANAHLKYFFTEKYWL